MTRITLVTAHPLDDSFNADLARAWRKGAEAEGAEVLSFNATELEFDPVLRGPQIRPEDDEPDLARLRRAVEESSHITLLFPTWWCGLPAALKGLVDRLFLARWAFRYHEYGFPIGLLKGCSARWITTMDSPRLWYWIMNRSALEGAVHNGTLRYVGFRPVRKTIIYGARTLNDSARQKWLVRAEGLGRKDARWARQLEAKQPQRLVVETALGGPRA
jgi:NAD(P)H dehydrogenase (quinone)